ncbi:hypothetical protein EVAR_91944_1 [Eumeta japonica]|uniref:DUF5641 domain-containing protein n=1 Tax=Eumeta variegata TaxID=151549 RepID=A0A4C1TA35_EUMVA|nr:hypothetical protein EVAR_91944_1 [Eumeta japonica]
MRAYLKIVPVELYGPEGSMKVHALLDEGSTVTLIDEQVANRIGAKGRRETLRVSSVGGNEITDEKSRVIRVKIKGLFSRNLKLMTAQTIRNLKLAPQRVERATVAACSHLTDIAENLIYDAAAPCILIGQDNWGLIVSRQIKSGRANQPAASLTQLGWVLHGCCSSLSRPINTVHHLRPSDASDIELNDIVKRHFEIESLGVAPRKPSHDPEERALVLLDSNSVRLPSGQFETCLLWKSDNETMPESYDTAMRRLRSIEKKLSKNDNLKREYCEQINNLLKNGYAEPAPNQSTSERLWYLPHFAVTHPQKKKVRLVFDAAARTNGKCLNDALLTGPDLIRSLLGVLVRFRQGRVAVSADIKEMFLRVKIREEDRDSLRFLWRNNMRKSTRVPNDVTDFRRRLIALYCDLHQNRNASEFELEYPEACKAIRLDHYVDDFLKSFNSIEEARRVSKQVYDIHRKAAFELRGWASNEIEVLNEMPDTRNDDNVQLGGDTRIEKTLGLQWDINNDALGFNLGLRNTPTEVLETSLPPTKRQVTSAVMSVFDPLGLASPVLITGKCMLQDIWRSGIDWDETIEADAHKKWLKWVNDIKKLASIRIPRCISPGHTEGELHVFVDASEKSYAAAVYWRIKLSEHESAVSLIAGKARVAPLESHIDPSARVESGATERSIELRSTSSTEKFIVRSVKTALAATLRERSPREEVLHTLLLEAEHIVNSRPLTEVDVEPAEAEGLTPNHFLIGRSCGAAAAGHFDDNVLLGPANWRTCQRLADHFWQRWLREYLPTLVPAGAATLCRAPAEGDIVLIVDSSSPRYSWPRGRIKKTYPGPDNQFVWWTSRRLVAFCGVPLRRSSCWCQLRRRLFRVLKCSCAPRGECYGQPRN